MLRRQSLGAAQQDVDLIVMATEGRQGIVDALRGSVTERCRARRALSGFGGAGKVKDRVWRQVLRFTAFGN